MSELELIIWLIGTAIIYFVLAYMFYKVEKESYDNPPGFEAFFISGGLFLSVFATMFVVLILLLLRYLIFGGVKWILLK